MKLKQKHVVWSISITLIVTLFIHNRYNEYTCSECGTSHRSEQWGIGSFNTIFIPISLNSSYVQESPLHKDFPKKKHEHEFTNHTDMFKKYFIRMGRRDYREFSSYYSNTFTKAYNRKVKLRDHIKQKILKEPDFENEIRDILNINEKKDEEFKMFMFTSDLIDEYQYGN